MLREAAQYYERNQISEAMSRVDRVIAGYPAAAETAEAYYLRGLCQSNKGQLNAAAADFGKALDLTDRNDLEANCHASLGAIAYQRRDWDGAARAYGKALAGLSDRPPTDEVLFAAGVAMQRAGRWSEGAAQFARVLGAFRNRPIAAAARKMAAWRHAYFAVQLGAFESATNAEQTLNAFKAKGLDSVQVESHPRGGRALWVVMAGRYPTYDAAAAALPRIQKVAPGAYIIPSP